MENSGIVIQKPISGSFIVDGGEVVNESVVSMGEDTNRFIDKLLSDKEMDVDCHQQPSGETGMEPQPSGSATTESSSSEEEEEEGEIVPVPLSKPGRRKILSMVTKALDYKNKPEYYDVQLKAQKECKLEKERKLLEAFEELVRAEFFLLPPEVLESIIQKKREDFEYMEAFERIKMGMTQEERTVHDKHMDQLETIKVKVVNDYKNREKEEKERVKIEKQERRKQQKALRARAAEGKETEKILTKLLVLDPPQLDVKNINDQDIIRIRQYNKNEPKKLYGEVIVPVKSLTNQLNKKM